MRLRVAVQAAVRISTPPPERTVGVEHEALRGRGRVGVRYLCVTGARLQLEAPAARAVHECMSCELLEQLLAVRGIDAEATRGLRSRRARHAGARCRWFGGPLAVLDQCQCSPPSLHACVMSGCEWRMMVEAAAAAVQHGILRRGAVVAGADVQRAAQAVVGGVPARPSSSTVPLGKT